jgi:hypothetical protein
MMKEMDGKTKRFKAPAKTPACFMFLFKHCSGRDANPVPLQNCASGRPLVLDDVIIPHENLTAFVVASHNCEQPSGICISLLKRCNNWIESSNCGRIPANARKKPTLFQYSWRGSALDRQPKSLNIHPLLQLHRLQHHIDDPLRLQPFAKAWDRFFARPDRMHESSRQVREDEFRRRAFCVLASG